MEGQPDARRAGVEAQAIEAWVAEFAERRERGEPLVVETFALEHPSGGERLLRALRALVSAEEHLPAFPPDVPACVGRYRVIGEVGRGGMGRVLRVQDEARAGEALALKLLHDSLQHDPRALERFRREAQALERVVHPGVVRLLDVGVDAGRPFFVMELVDGAPLSRLFAESRRDASRPLELPGTGDRYVRAARLSAQCARAVAAAHAEGVLHRDLNPRNVILCSDGRPVLVDFGLVHAEGSKTLTGTGDLIGTPQYMAPEQARGERVDARVDVFGLGVILFELATLAPPRPAEETFALLRRASDVPLPPPRSVDPTLPRELARIVSMATAFRPQWRYADAALLAADLEAFVEGRPIAARAPPIRRRIHELWLRRRRAILLGGAAALLLAAPTVYWLGGRNARSPAQAERARELHNQMLVALLDGDLRAARAKQAELEPLAPDDDRAVLFRALVIGELPASSDDPAVRALIDGERLRRAGRPAEALPHFDVSLNLAPDAVLGVALRALARLEAGQFAEAADGLESVARELSASLTLHRSLGRAYEGQALTADAVMAREAARALAPGDPVIGFDLARAYYEADRPADALAQARRVLDLDAVTGRELCAAFAQRLAERGQDQAAAAYAELAHD